MIEVIGRRQRVEHGVVDVTHSYGRPGEVMASSLISSLLTRFDIRGGSAVLLFGGPCVVCHGDRLEVPDGSKRLLAFVALSAGRVDRRYAAGALWPEGSDRRAAGSLRSALWRLRNAHIDVLESDNSTLTLRPGTTVDAVVVCDWAARLVDGSATQDDLYVANWRGGTLELLPAWYDDWLIFERERIRQRVLHALEALSRRLIEAGRSADAVDAALWAVSADPLRESANRVLIEAHLAEGNRIEARRAYLLYRDTVRRELGIEPGRQLTSLVRATIPPPRRPRGSAAASAERLAASG